MQTLSSSVECIAKESQKTSKAICNIDRLLADHYTKEMPINIEEPVIHPSRKGKEKVTVGDPVNTTKPMEECNQNNVNLSTGYEDNFHIILEISDGEDDNGIKKGSALTPIVGLRKGVCNITPDTRHSPKLIGRSNKIKSTRFAEKLDSAVQRSNFRRLPVSKVH